MKTLLSMTDFVTASFNKIKKNDTDVIMEYLTVCKYARFLKQPLKLEIFVPCDDEGLPLSLEGLTDSEGYVLDEIEFNEFEKAKEKVLFEGFEVDKDGDIVHKGKKLIVNTETCRINQIVESYVGKNLTLTPTALKQIGL